MHPLPNFPAPYPHLNINMFKSCAFHISTKTLLYTLHGSKLQYYIMVLYDDHGIQNIYTKNIYKTSRGYTALPTYIPLYRFQIKRVAKKEKPLCIKSTVKNFPVCAVFLFSVFTI